MEKKFAVRKNLLCLLGLVLCLGCLLSGCSSEKPADDQSSQVPALLYYYNGIITAEGELIFPPGENEYNILLDKQSRQCYILETEKQLDLEQRTNYGEPLLVGCTLRIYDLQGQLQKELYVQAEGSVDDTVSFYFAPDGSLEKSRILVNRLLTEGSLQVLDCDGKLLLEEQILQPEELEALENAYAYASLGLADNFFNISYDLYGQSEYIQNGNFFYDINGQPLEAAQDYSYFYNAYDEYNTCVSDYYVAAYEVAPGQFLHDLLDGNGQVIVSGLTFVEHFADGFFVVQQGFNRGLIDGQGNWIYQESIFVDLED